MVAQKKFIPVPGVEHPSSVASRSCPIKRNCIIVVILSYNLQLFLKQFTHIGTVLHTSFIWPGKREHSECCKQYVDCIRLYTRIWLQVHFPFVCNLYFVTWRNFKRAWPPLNRGWTLKAGIWNCYKYLPIRYLQFYMPYWPWCRYTHEQFYLTLSLQIYFCKPV